MKRVNILDCTLRDGAYLIDSQFGNTAIKGIIEGLTESGIDVIECGFLKDEPHREGTTIFNNAAQLRSFLPTDKRHSSYVCLADYSRYHIDNLEPYDGTSIDGVRACFFKNERFEVIDFCKAIVNKGYKLYVQPVDILGYTDAELLDLIEKINELEPYAFSIVDTFGQAEELLRQMGLEDRMNNYPHQLSGGQCQRVAIARALALQPDILCFDEPTSALDPELTGEVLKVLRNLADKKTTMIIVTHEMAFAKDVASQVIFMDDGYILEQGRPDQVFDNPKMERTKQFLSSYS